METAQTVLLSVILFFQIIFGLAHSGSQGNILEAIKANSIDRFMGKGQ